jgi:hypothetical protein
MKVSLPHVPLFFLATKNHKSHKPDDLLNRTCKLFVDFVPFSGYQVAKNLAASFGMARVWAGKP